MVLFCFPQVVPPAAPESCTVACGALTYKCEHGGCSCTAGSGARGHIFQARGRCSDGSSAKVVTLGDDGKEVSRGSGAACSSLLLLAVVAAHLAVSLNITDTDQHQHCIIRRTKCAQ